jgi:hypothetical protein
MTDEEALQILQEFVYTSYDKGYVYLGIDFEDLMLAIHTASEWYTTIQKDKQNGNNSSYIS